MIPPSSISPKSSAFQSTQTARKLAEHPFGSIPAVGQTFVRFGNGNNTEDMGVLKTLKSLYSHLWKPGNKDYIKGYALKFGPDVAVPALFSIPVVGWIGGLLALPFTSMASNAGDKIIKKAVGEQGNQNNPFTHLIDMTHTWQGNPKDWNKKEKDVVGQLKDHYDKFIDNLLPEKNDDNLRKKIRIGEKGKDSKIFKTLEDLVSTKMRLSKSWFRHLATPFTWLHKGLSKMKFFPRALARVFLLPKFLLFGLFYLTRKRGAKLAH